MIGEDADLLTDKPIDPNKETFQVLAISVVLDTGYEWRPHREEHNTHTELQVFRH